jgi:hypothetical protein
MDFGFPDCHGRRASMELQLNCMEIAFFWCDACCILGFAAQQLGHIA